MDIDQEIAEQIVGKFAADLQQNGIQVYRTRAGNIALVLSRVAGDEWGALLGAYYTSNDVESGHWIPVKWGTDGTYGSINEKLTHSGLDLIMEVKGASA